MSDASTALISSANASAAAAADLAVPSPGEVFDPATFVARLRVAESGPQAVPLEAVQDALRLKLTDL